MYSINLPNKGNANTKHEQSALCTPCLLVLPADGGKIVGYEDITHLPFSTVNCNYFWPSTVPMHPSPNCPYLTRVCVFSDLSTALCLLLYLGQIHLVICCSLVIPQIECLLCTSKIVCAFWWNTDETLKALFSLKNIYIKFAENVNFWEMFYPLKHKIFTIKNKKVKS